MTARLFRPTFVLSLALAAVWLLSACGTPPVATPAPTPQAVFLTYPPELRPYAEALAACARQYPEIALYLNETLAEPASDGQSSLFLAMGSQPSSLSDWKATLMAEERLVVVVNQANPLESLSVEQLRALWSGRLPSWQALGGGAEAVQVWTYAEGTALGERFEAAVMAGELTSSTAWLAPDPQAVLEAVAAEAGAIGYLPGAWLEGADDALAEAVRVMQVPTELDEAFRMAVLALTEAEPQGALRSLLVCFHRP